MHDDQTNGGNVRSIRPHHTAAGAVPGEHQSARRRGSRSKFSQRTERRLQRLQMALVVILSAVVLVGLGIGVYMKRLKDERDMIYREALRLERVLTETLATLETVTAERDTLVNARIPGLEPLIYDETIPVERDYVRNVVFTLARKNDTPSYEYRVVLSNEGLTMVLPDLRILLFDQLGIQLGEAGVPAELLESGEEEISLEPGEVRTHSGVIEFVSNEPPKYFFLQID